VLLNLLEQRGHTIMKNRNYNYRKLYILHHGPITEGHDVHHKLPRRLGGTDDVYNLESLDRKTHSIRHLRLYEKHGDIKDLTAHYMLSGEYPPTVRRKISSIAGKIGGAKTAKEGLGIHGGSNNERSKWGKMGGLSGGWKIQQKNKNGIYDPKNQKKYASLGGHAAPQFRDSSFQSSMGKRGGAKNKGFFWITDGTVTKKYTKSMQLKCSIEKYLKENKAFRRGRTYKRKINEN